MTATVQPAEVLAPLLWEAIRVADPDGHLPAWDELPSYGDPVELPDGGAVTELMIAAARRAIAVISNDLAEIEATLTEQAITVLGVDLALVELRRSAETIDKIRVALQRQADLLGGRTPRELDESALLKLVHRAICDPGVFTERHMLHEGWAGPEWESSSHWSARGFLAALKQAGLSVVTAAPSTAAEQPK